MKVRKANEREREKERERDQEMIRWVKDESIWTWCWCYSRLFYLQTKQNNLSLFIKKDVNKRKKKSKFKYVNELIIYILSLSGSENICKKKKTHFETKKLVKTLNQRATNCAEDRVCNMLQFASSQVELKLNLTSKKQGSTILKKSFNQETLWNNNFYIICRERQHF